MRRALCQIAACLLLAGLLGGAPAWAAAPGPALTIESQALPSVFSPEHVSTGTPDSYVLTVTNSGSEPTDGSAIEIGDTPADSLAAQSIGGILQSSELGTGLSCEWAARLRCAYSGTLAPGDSLRVLIVVAVAPGTAGSVTNTATASGGGAATALTRETTPVGGAAESLAVPFGVQSFAFLVGGANGLTETQAGAHPYQNTVSFTLDSVPRAQREDYLVAGGLGGSAGAVKDLVFDLPPGFLGNPSAIERCPQYKVPSGECPATTQIGVAKIYSAPPAGSRALQNVVTISPIYNVVPGQGFPAEFELYDKTPVTLYATVDPKTNYSVRVTIPDIPAAGHVLGSSTTFFGTPSANADYANHNSGATQTAFLENPTGCTTEPQYAHVYADTWQQLAATLPDGAPDLSDPNWVRAQTVVFPEVSGCELLQFNPSLEVRPDATRADEPAGMTVDLNLPQAPLTEGELGSPALKAATVTLPSGISVSPSAADGLEGCALAQIELLSASAGPLPAGVAIGHGEGDDAAA